MNIGIFTDTYFPQLNGVATSVQTLRRELEKGDIRYISSRLMTRGSSRKRTITSSVYPVCPLFSSKIIGLALSARPIFCVRFTS